MLIKYLLVYNFFRKVWSLDSSEMWYNFENSFKTVTQKKQDCPPLNIPTFGFYLYGHQYNIPASLEMVVLQMERS